MSDQSLRERVIRAMWGKWLDQSPTTPRVSWDEMVDRAKTPEQHPVAARMVRTGYEETDAIMDAFLEHISANGLAIVPVTWTKEMADQATSDLEDAIEWTRDSYSTYIVEQPGHWAATAYDGAVKAAPPAADLLKGTQDE